MNTIRKIITLLLFICIIGIFLFGIGVAQHNIWNGVSRRLKESSSLSGLIPNGKKIKPILFGFDMLGADTYWVKTVMYIGDNALDKSKSGLYPLVNLVTDLDNKFWNAYRQGILLLPDVKRKEETKKLIKKAEKNMPERWEPLYAGGFYYFFYENDYDTSIEYYKKCIKISGCLSGAKRMIRNLEARRGKYGIAIEEYLKELQNQEISDEDYDLFLKKIEESAKLLVLNDAARKFIKKHTYLKNSKKKLETLQDLENFQFIPDKETLRVVNILKQNSSIFTFQFNIKKSGEIVIDKNTLIPAFEINEMKWSKKEKRVRTRVF